MNFTTAMRTVLFEKVCILLMEGHAGVSFGGSISAAFYYC